MINTEEVKSTNVKVKYNDTGIRVVLSLIAAHIMSSYNEVEGFFELVFTISYIRGFLVSFVIAFIILTYIYSITVRLDRLFDWHNNTFQRFIWQVILGIAAPALIVFALVALFLWLYDINIFRTKYLDQDYPLVLLMLLIVNLYYFGLYCFLITKMKVKYSLSQAEIEDPQAIPQNAPEYQLPFKETIIINTPLKTFPIKTDEIAYIFRLSDGVFIRLQSMVNLNESYPTNYSLKDLESLLDPSKFFRINRQMIVSYRSVISFQSETPKTLSLNLYPELYPVDRDIPAGHEKLTIVSENRSPSFKLWMER